MFTSALPAASTISKVNAQSLNRGLWNRHLASPVVEPFRRLRPAASCLAIRANLPTAKFL